MSSQICASYIVLPLTLPAGVSALTSLQVIFHDMLAPVLPAVDAQMLLQSWLVEGGKVCPRPPTASLVLPLLLPYPHS